MNIEVANKLVELRKTHNLSQEALAEKLGISRQAVSKWERAEASPDTDNLISLARLYRISLDDLLMTGNGHSGSDAGKEMGHMEQGEMEAGIPGETEQVQQRTPETVMRRETQQHEGAVMKTAELMEQRQLEGVILKKAEPVEQRQPEEAILKTAEQWHPEPVMKREQESVVIIEEERPKIDYSMLRHFPIYVVVAIAFFILGAFWNAWHPGWMLFFIPPMWQTAMMALEKGDAKYFAYPVFVTFLYLCLGVFASLWHPGWIVFLTIPLYYPLVKYFRKLYKIQKKELDDILHQVH